jgi:hypothetical protein
MITALLFSAALSTTQVYWAEEAFKVGNPYGLGLTLSAIIGQESSYCQNKINGWSRGCSQIKRATARIFDPGVTREELTRDNQRNIKDGLAFLLYCRTNTTSWRRSVACFHWGLPHESQMSDTEINSDAYVSAVIARLPKESHD